ncbi:MAG TPA: phosphate acyltransferase PlsX [Streptosporangiaceae bacterium]
MPDNPPLPASSQPATVAVDAMGGDHAPEAVVAGAVAAVTEHGIPVILTGRPSLLRPLLPSGLRPGVIRIAAADDSLTMDEGAMASWRRPRSSVAVACQLVHRGQAAAVVSAGSTGGLVATAQLRLRSLPGLLRPGLAVVLPTRPKPTLLVDAGAIADPRPEMLVQFAQLGVAYAQVAFGVADPLVGLLTIGAEPVKGNKLARRAHELLAGPPHGRPPIRFAGNIEGSDLLAGLVDVVVTDGFTGNVALKAIEGAAGFATGQFRAALRSSRAARFGAAFQRQALRELAGQMDAETYGGAALLGLEGTVVIAHGDSSAKGIASACRLAADLARGQITEKIQGRLGPAHRGGHFLRRS